MCPGGKKGQERPQNQTAKEDKMTTEISLNLDENGRTIASNILNSVSLDYSTRILDLELNHSNLSNIVHDCEVTVNSSLPWTFWMPCNSQVRNHLKNRLLLE
jgi:hypothetical protein